jgi:peptidoglycan L-alanyl-D-glutamate endopeptidase CwlK
MLVTCTLRTNAEQEQRYAQGRTTPGSIVTDARPGFSAHNYGLAMDVVPIVAGKCVWNTSDPAWRTLGALGQAAGLDWAGAPGFPFHELPHFQMPNWRQLAGLE